MTAGASLGVALRLAVPTIGAMSATGSVVAVAVHARYAAECATATTPSKRAEAGLLTQLEKMCANMFAMQLAAAYSLAVSVQWRLAAGRANSTEIFSDTVINEASSSPGRWRWLRRRSSRRSPPRADPPPERAGVATAAAVTTTRGSAVAAAATAVAAAMARRTQRRRASARSC